jgi:YD repeat-containing protein
MIKKFLIVLCVMAIATLGVNENAHAQSRNCTAWFLGGLTSLYGDGTNALVAGVYDCVGTGSWNVQCLVRTASCAPTASSSEVCLACTKAGKPVDLATGNTYIKETDVAIPGTSGGLSLVRTWNSAWPATQITSSLGIFGPNWRSTFEERIFVGSDHYIKYSRGDGSYWSFGYGNGGLSLAAPQNVKATLLQNTGYLNLTFQNGEQRRFDSTSGSLIAIVDRNGNTTQLAYDSSNRLISVTDPASRHLYFNYANPSSYLVTGVTSDFGITLSYTYDSSGRLIQVTKPDLTTVNYSYNSQSQITQVTDSNGKVLESHTYDSSGRGLTSSQANGVNSLIVTYPQ